MTAGKGDEPQDPGDAELDALMQAADEELLAYVKGAVDLEAGSAAILRDAGVPDPGRSGAAVSAMGTGDDFGADPRRRRGTPPTGCSCGC